MRVLTEPGQCRTRCACVDAVGGVLLGQLTPSLVTAVFTELANGLQDIHCFRVVHRNLRCDTACVTQAPPPSASTPLHIKWSGFDHAIQMRRAAAGKLLPNLHEGAASVPSGSHRQCPTVATCGWVPSPTPTLASALCVFHLFLPLLCWTLLTLMSGATTLRWSFLFGDVTFLVLCVCPPVVCPPPPVLVACRLVNVWWVCCAAV